MSETKFDPASMELEDNFFDKQNMEDEQSFKDQFEPPITPTTNVDDIDPPPGKEDGSEEDDEGKEKTEDFKFDDALAEDERKELEELNAKMGTNFESMNELNQALKGHDKDEQKDLIEEEKKYINYFNQLLDTQKYSDEDLVREDKRIMAINNEQDLKDPEVQQDIEFEVSKLADSGMIHYAAKAIRDNLKMSLEKKQKTVNDYEQSKQLTVKEQQDKYKQELQEGVNSIFKQGEFLGIKPTKEDMLEIYKDINKNKHIDHLKAHPKDAVEFALFKKYQEQIKKNLGKPNYEAGVKQTLSELGMSTASQTGNNGKDIAKDSNAGDLSFLQKFAK